MRYEDSCVSEEINRYSEEHSSDEHPILQELTRQTHLRMINPRMISGKQQGLLLQILCKLKRPKNILEIGTFTAYSTIAMALAIDDDAKITTIERNEEYEIIIDEFVEKSGQSHKIDLIIGDALEVIPKLDKKWDLVFIDGDKREYERYFDLIIDKVSPSGLIIADNVLWSGKVLIESEVEKDEQTAAVDAFNKKVSQDKRVDSLLLPFRDGLMILVKR